MKLKHTCKIGSLVFTMLFFPLLAQAQMDMPEGIQHNHPPKNLPETALTPQLKISISEDDNHGVWRKNGKEIISTIFINTHKKHIVSHQFSSFPILVANP
ncbi:hypothetical protein A9Q81_17135 [Gammaproteobacteria bacterium 42_54_T18]|nr:hypothetical protein A9Q81_17135 [Gammaproteobacteria bacterium 42_54_T18]